MTERNASIAFTFQEHEGHYHAASASVERSGVPASLMLDSMFAVMEEVIMHELLDHPKVQELIGWKYEVDDMLWSLEERTKRLAVKLLAHKLMLGRVASRSYQTDARSTSLTLPMDD